MKAVYENRSFERDFPVHVLNSGSFNFFAHWHSEIEIVYVYEGNFRIGINNISKVLSKGQLAICTSGDIHYFNADEGPCGCIIIIFMPEVIGFPHGWPEKVFFNPPFITEYNPELIGKFEEIFREISSEYEKKKDFYRDVIRGRLIELCAILTRNFAAAGDETCSSSKRTSGLHKIKKAIVFMEQNYNKEICLDDTSEEVGLSRFYFSRTFRRITGMNFTDYLNNIRIQKTVKAIIESPHKNLTEIAFESGFNSVRSFNRTFLNIMGVQPSSLRSDSKVISRKGL